MNDYHSPSSQYDRVYAIAFRSICADILTRMQRGVPKLIEDHASYVAFVVDPESGNILKRSSSNLGPDIDTIMEETAQKMRKLVPPLRTKGEYLMLKCLQTQLTVDSESNRNFL